MKKAKEANFIFMKKTTGEKIVHAVVFLIFFVYAFSLLFPLFWLLIQSLFEPTGYRTLQVINKNSGTIFSFPEDGWYFSNYVTAFQKLTYNQTNFFGMLFNSLWYIAIAETWCLLWPIMTGFIFAKYNFRGKGIFHSVIIFTLTVPVVGTTGAMYKLVTWLNLFDTGPLFVITTGIGGFSSGFLIYYGIFKGISWSYAEAVFIDGGGNNTAFFRVILPQAMPAISAMMISTMIMHWNEYYQFLMFLPSFPTVATGLYNLSLDNHVDKPLVFAGLVTTMLPVLILYGFMAGRMMKNLSIGGLKG